MPLSYQLSYFICAFLNLTIALAIYLRRPKESLVKAFAAFITSVTAWIITLYFFYTISTAVEVIVVGRINFVFAEMIAYFAYLFVYLFPEKTWRMPAWLNSALAGGMVLLCAITFSTDLVDQVEIVKGVSRVTEYGPLYILFVLEFVGFGLASIVLLISKYRRTTGAARRQILLFALGWGGTLLMGVTTNIVLPGLTGNYDVQNLGPLSTLFLVAATGYAVARHELLNVKVLATEVFLAALLLIFVINSALTTSLSGQILGGVSFMLVLILGVLLVRSVRIEVERRKELQILTLQLREANDHLKEADKLKSEFISIASHQLRTPITVIKGYISLMLEGAYGPLGDSLRDKIVNMNAMNERLVQMINNMLNVTRIERNRIEYSCAQIDVAPLAREVVEEMALKAKEKGLSLLSAIPDEEAVTAYVDSEKVQEVLTNLVDNAIKYTPTGSVEVAVRRLPKKNEVLVTVKDSGLGMDKETAKSVFQKFFRSNDPNVARETGTGLGLYICAMFIRGMGGDIWIERTAPGKGTTVAFRIPTVPGGKCLPKDRRQAAR